MAVSNGQAVNAAVSNAAWMSRLVDTSTVGIVTLSNADGASLDSIANVQRAINILRQTETSTQSLGVTGAITVVGFGTQLIPVESTSGAVETALLLFGSTPPLNNTEVSLVGLSDTDYIEILNHDAQYGLLLNGQCDLKRGVMITFKYVGALERWVEKCRNI